MQKTTEIGKKGEILAKDFLIAKNYTILFMNWRYKHSEIDIIAQDGKMIVFVEVKSRKNNQYGNPEEFVTKHKIKKRRIYPCT